MAEGPTAVSVVAAAVIEAAPGRLTGQMVIQHTDPDLVTGGYS